MSSVESPVRSSVRPNLFNNHSLVCSIASGHGSPGKEGIFECAADKGAGSLCSSHTGGEATVTLWKGKAKSQQLMILMTFDSLFSSLFGFLQYETKKHKAGLKTADTILKKFPEHGETLCMKGLLLASSNRHTEGLELAKQGVRFDLTSFIAWHALGILNRMSKNYNESIKCYLQALKIEGGNNVNLIRESAYLYVQLRDWSKVVETRSNLVRIQPHLRMNWIGLVLALHLGEDYTEAIRVLEQFELIHRVSWCCSKEEIGKEVLGI